MHSLEIERYFGHDTNIWPVRLELLPSGPEARAPQSISSLSVPHAPNDFLFFSDEASWVRSTTDLGGAV